MHAPNTVPDIKADTQFKNHFQILIFFYQVPYGLATEIQVLYLNIVYKI